MKNPEKVAEEVYKNWRENLGSSLIFHIAQAIQAERDARMPSLSAYADWLIKFNTEQGYRASPVEMYQWLCDNMKPAEVSYENK